MGHDHVILETEKMESGAGRAAFERGQTELDFSGRHQGDHRLSVPDMVRMLATQQHLNES